MQTAQLSKSHSRRLSLLWLLPLTALIFGLYLAYTHLNEVGKTIEIRFSSAEGLQAGRTAIRYKEMTIGTVSDVRLSEDLNSVIIKAQMQASADPLLREDSIFWVVKPEISRAGISGLSTLISGNYIAVHPGTSTIKAQYFNGAEQQPLIPPTEAGIRLRLFTSALKGIKVGSSIYYRGMNVGKIERIHYDNEADHIELSAFIFAPYDKLINSNTKFWNVSGFSFSFGTAAGAKLQMESLESLLLGGITFNTPAVFYANNAPVSENTLFRLYANEKDTTRISYTNKQYYVLYFNDSMRGLRVGAPVSFDGINIGQVIDIRLIYDQNKNHAAIPVLIEIEPDRIDRVQQVDTTSDIIADLVKHGMQASMETGNLLTGERYIQLSMYENSKEDFRPDAYSQYPVMPSRSTGITRITDGVADVIDKIRKLPFDEFLQKANNMVDKAGDVASEFKQIVNAKEVQQIGTSINQTLRQFTNTMASIQSVSTETATFLNQINRNFAQIAEQIESALQGLSPESSLYWTLHETLREIKSTARSFDKVLKTIDRKPNSLILGE